MIFFISAEAVGSAPLMWAISPAAMPCSPAHSQDHGQIEL